MRELVDHDSVAGMAKEIAAADADEHHNQYPAYHADIAAETCKALDALRTDPVHRERYTRFVADMVYGEKAEFDDALATATAMARRWIEGSVGGTGC
jgi:hypothetical protein